MAVGYEYLRRSLGLPVPPVQRPATVQPVIRVGPGAHDTLAIPALVAPQGDDPLEHLLFALKHEGTNLLVLHHVLQAIPGERMVQELRKTPTGRFLRKAGYLWEHVNGKTLDGAQPRGNYVELFDPKLYITGPAQRDPRWRVIFNGLGSLRYCPSVRRTPAIEALLKKDLLGQATRFAEEIGPAQLDRALAWAYLGETESSFAIERETPTADKAAAFGALLRQAGDGRPVTEAFLVELQNSAITNPLERAQQYRDEQNWLRGPARGAVGVTYVAPPPDAVPDLMDNLLRMANAPQGHDPLVLAAAVSFGFVFIHPFMDGNGRLSRFLVHHVLGQSGRLPKGFVLPVSIAMKRNEGDYLVALQSFSKPLRDLWRVTWIDEGRYDFEFLSDDAVYRHWDATRGVEFLLRMAEQALQKDLREESRFLESYDAAAKEVNERFDIRSNALATLLLSAFQNHGTVPEHRRKQFADVVPDAAFDFIEEVVRLQLAEQLEQPRAEGT
jgi:hypothetical protein